MVNANGQIAWKVSIFFRTLLENSDADNPDCPSGWVRMMRKDGGECGIEYMVDQGGCLSGKHQLCCPPDDVPTCGWYTHNNGKCDQKCGDGSKFKSHQFPHVQLIPLYVGPKQHLVEPGILRAA